MGHEGEMREAMRWVAQAKDDLSAAQESSVRILTQEGSGFLRPRAALRICLW